VKNITISKKIGMAFCVVIALFLAGMWISITATQSIAAKSEHFFEVSYARQQAYQIMFSDGLLSGIALRNLVLRPTLKKPFKVVPKAIARFDSALAKAEALSENDASLQKSLALIKSHWVQSKMAKLDVLKAMKEGNIETAKTILIKREHPQWRKTRIEVQNLVLAEEKNTKIIENEILVQGEDTLRNSSIFAGIIIVLAILVGYSVTQLLTKTFGQIIKSLHDIASGDGDLTSRLDETGKDEAAHLAKAFNEFIQKIQLLIVEARKSGSELSASAEKLSGISVGTKLNVNQQESMIERVATAINEMESTVQEVASHATEASKAAQSANVESSNGQSVVTDVISSISDLASEVHTTSEIIKTLDQNAENIGGVLDVIKGIAEQTNLLALNAAIEAARAGEQGRGFAVVADEVRTLASRTQQSTQEIQSMIELLQGGAKSAVKAMELGEEKTQNTVDKAQSAGDALAEITVAVSQIVEMNTQIADAVNEQSVVAEDINKNISSISSLSVEAAEGAEHTASSSQDLERLAADLDNIMSSFKV